MRFGLWCGFIVGSSLSLTMMGVGTFERPRIPCGGPWAFARFVCMVAIVLAGAAAGETREALAFELGDHVPEWGSLIVVTY